MDKEWVSLFITTEDFKAELVKGLLKENGIESVLVNKKDTFYHFGDIEIFVKRDNFITAKYLIKEL